MQRNLKKDFTNGVWLWGAPWTFYCVGSNWINDSGNSSWLQYYTSCPLVCPGGEEGADHSADCSSAAVWHPRRGHQPLHGHLQEDGWRLCRPLRLLLHLHHLPRDPPALRLRDSLTTNGPLIAPFLPRCFFFFFFTLQKPAPCVSYFSRPWSFTPADLHLSYMVESHVTRCENAR